MALGLVLALMAAVVALDRGLASRSSVPRCIPDRFREWGSLDRCIMNSHYGPEWYWDKTRPEAIVALSQMEESHRIMNSLRREKSATQEQIQISPGSAAKHFRLHEFRPSAV